MFSKDTTSNKFYKLNDEKVSSLENFESLLRQSESQCYIITYEQNLEESVKNSNSEILKVDDECYDVECKSPKSERPLDKFSPLQRQHIKKIDLQKKRREENVESNISVEKVSKREQNKLDKLRFKCFIHDKILSYRETVIQKLSKNKEMLSIIQDLREVPNEVCVCCARIGFQADHRKLNFQKIFNLFNKKNDEYTDINEFTKDIVATESSSICRTCYDTIVQRHKIPIYGPKYGLKFQAIPDFLKNLTELEERLISPVICFMQVRDLKPHSLNSELGAKGAVVNIMVDVPKMLTTTLPRKFNNTDALQIMLKRHFDHQTYYKFETVRVKHVFDSLHYLNDKPLYKDLNLKIDDEAFSDYDQLRVGEHLNFIVDPEEFSEEEKKYSKDKNLNKEELEAEEIEEFLRRVEASVEKDNEFFGREGGNEDVLCFKMPINVDDIDNIEKIANDPNPTSTQKSNPVHDSMKVT